MTADSPRIAELRRRVHADPASIAFAQLAEEYRRAGNYDEAVKYCRTGLARHPGYLSARVTLGRALIEIGGLDEAARELLLVLKSAPDNLAAIRGMAEIEQRRGDLIAALDYYTRALALARFDPELEETVNRIGRELGQVSAQAGGEVLSFEQAHSELLSAAERMPSAEPTPAAEPADSTAAALPGDVAGRDEPSGASTMPEVADPPALIDFDALLASLGVPDAAPPAIMEMLLSGSTGPGVRAEWPDPHASLPAEDSFAELERELRALENPSAPPAPSPDAAVAAVVEELEAWLHVLQSERAS